MPDQTLTAEFPDVSSADSAIGRLEILGVPRRIIHKASSTGTHITVSVEVEDRLAEKARHILQGG